MFNPMIACNIDTALYDEDQAPDMYRLDTPPSMEATEALNELYRHGFHIAFVTYRPPEMRQSIRRWMLRHGLPIPWILRFIGPDVNLQAVLGSLGARVAVETDGEAALEMARYGLYVVLIDRTDNQDAAHEHIIRVPSWKHAAAFIIARAMNEAKQLMVQAKHAIVG